LKKTKTKKTILFKKKKKKKKERTIESHEIRSRSTQNLSGRVGEKGESMGGG